MPVVSNPNRAPRLHPMRDFTGGISFAPAKDNEFEQFTNFEVLRDGYATNRLGAWQLNANSLGGAAPVGLGTATVGASGSAITTYLIYARASTAWHYCAMPTPTIICPPASTPLNFSTLSVPTSPGTDRVRIESFEDSTGNAVALFANKNFPVTQWNGTAVTPCTGAPKAQYICAFNTRCYAAGVVGDYLNLYFSDKGKQNSWPTANKIPVVAKYGAITGFGVQPGRMLIFCERAVLALYGDPPIEGQYSVDLVHEKIGCDIPSSLSSFGSSIGFMFSNDAYVFDNDVRILSAKVEGRVAGGGTCGALMPEYYAVAPGSAQLRMGSRRNYGAWTDWNYSAFGTPSQSVIAAPDASGVVIAGSDGNLYAQPLRNMAGNMQDDALTLNFTGDLGGVVYGTLRTRRMDFGDPAQQKVLRKLLIGGQGSFVNVVARLWDPQGTVSTNAFSTTSIPCDLTLQLQNIPMRFSQMQLDITGSVMQVRGIDLAVSSGRFSTIKTLGAASGSGSVVVSSVTVLPSTYVMLLSGSYGFTATAHYSDGSAQDVTAMAVWASSDVTVATVTAGSVAAVAPGSASITATVSSKTGSAALTVSSEQEDFIVVGQIIMWPTSTPPSGWILYDGSSKVTADYAALSALLKPVYGGADADHFYVGPQTTLGRTPVNVGAGAGLTARTLTDSPWGAETHTLDATEMPTHTHVATVTDPKHTHTASVTEQSGAGAQGYTAGAAAFLATSVTTSLEPTGVTVDNADTGGGGAHDNVQPSFPTNFIIRYQ